ncbi:TRAP transporter small permease [Mesorhizobium sp. SB112]|uniref:TRAP transporter small permease subunit n=1 Tax=Mesorhizobium sp. SB112 TaxID=3151853 RepID=UPI003267DBF9
MTTQGYSARPLALLATVATLATRICGLVVFLMAFLIAVDVVVRKLFNSTLFSGGVGEISGYVLGIISAWGAASALLARSHVRIDTVQIMLPRSVGRLADIVAIAMFTLASGTLAYVAYFTFKRTFILNSHSMTPLAVPIAIPQGLWFAGLCFLTAVSLALSMAGIVAILKGDHRTAHALIGPRSIEEEVEEQQAIVGAVSEVTKP